jgi:hypothetical protein
MRVSLVKVALYNYSTGAFVRFLSDPTNSATWEVTRINQWLPATRTLYATLARLCACACALMRRVDRATVCTRARR